MKASNEEVNKLTETVKLLQDENRSQKRKIDFLMDNREQLEGKHNELARSLISLQRSLTSSEMTWRSQKPLKNLCLRKYRSWRAKIWFKWSKWKNSNSNSKSPKVTTNPQAKCNILQKSLMICEINLRWPRKLLKHWTQRQQIFSVRKRCLKRTAKRCRYNSASPKVSSPQLLS